jgi:DNA-binding transcriptional LysR family regulator
MNLKRLEVFYLVAKYGTCSKAADELSVTQPAVSMQLRGLERFYRVKLFYRVGNRLQLTEAGERLYSYAKDIFQLAGEAENCLLDKGKMLKGTLRIGTISSYTKRVLPPLISSFHKSNPFVKVVVQEGRSYQMAESVAGMKNEVALAADTGFWKRMSSIPFRNEELVLVASNKHRWFGVKDEIDVEELKKESIIHREEGSAARYVISEFFKKYHFDPAIFLEGGSPDFIKEMVKSGKGLSFFMHLSVSDEIKRGIFKPISISSGKLFLDVRFWFLDRDFLSPPALEFLRMAKVL